METTSIDVISSTTHVIPSHPLVCGPSETAPASLVEPPCRASQLELVGLFAGTGQGSCWAGLFLKGTSEDTAGVLAVDSLAWPALLTGLQARTTELPYVLLGGGATPLLSNQHIATAARHINIHSLANIGGV